MPPRNARPDLIDKLTDGIRGLTSSQEWQRYLEVQSRFHSYSFSNVLLIAAQSPTATRIAGFHTWRNLGRTVRRGEKAIWILAPMIYKKDQEHAEDSRAEIRGFKFVPVFDVSQTEGDELPSICHRLSGDDAHRHFDDLVAVARSLEFTVEEVQLEGAMNGRCSHVVRRIQIECRNAPTQNVKTLAHELAHAILHESVESRSLAELEAESTAFVVCHKLGVDSARYSFGYVASWAGGGEAAVTAIKASSRRIQHAAATILNGLECGTEQAVA
jgi:antirestriction protein ArdC